MMKYFLLLIFSFNAVASANPCVENKAVTLIDIDSITLKYASVDTCKETILETYYHAKTRIDFDVIKTKDLSEVRQNEILKIIHTLVQNGQVDTRNKFHIFATPPFDKVTNTKELNDKVRKHFHTSLTILSDREDALLKHQAVQKAISPRDDHFIIWDINNMGQKIFVKKGKNGLIQYQGQTSAQEFYQYILTTILKLPDTPSPNPIGMHHFYEAVAHARFLAKEETSRRIKRKIKKAKLIVGIGNIHSENIRNQVHPSLDGYTLKELQKAADLMAELNDKRIGGKNPQMTASNFAFVLGFMQALQIKQIRILSIDLMDSLLLSNK